MFNPDLQPKYLKLTMRQLFLILTLSLFGQTAICQDNRMFINVDLSMTDLYVVNLEVIKKIGDGLCDCSIGQKRKNDDCQLYEIKIKNVKHQADSTVFLKRDILQITRLIVPGHLNDRINRDEKLTVILGNTSSKDYLKLNNLLPNVIGKDFRFRTEYAHLTSLVECESNDQTFRKK
jgi:hypothetical protein